MQETEQTARQGAELSSLTDEQILEKLGMLTPEQIQALLRIAPQDDNALIAELQEAFGNVDYNDYYSVKTGQILIKHYEKTTQAIKKQFTRYNQRFANEIATIEALIHSATHFTEEDQAEAAECIKECQELLHDQVIDDYKAFFKDSFDAIIAFDGEKIYQRTWNEVLLLLNSRIAYELEDPFNYSNGVFITLNDLEKKIEAGEAIAGIDVREFVSPYGAARVDIIRNSPSFQKWREKEEQEFAQFQIEEKKRVSEQQIYQTKSVQRSLLEEFKEKVSQRSFSPGTRKTAERIKKTLPAVSGQKQPLPMQHDPKQSPVCVVETQEQQAFEQQTIPSDSPARLTTQSQGETDENKPFGQVVNAIETSLQSLNELDRHNVSQGSFSPGTRKTTKRIKNTLPAVSGQKQPLLMQHDPKQSPVRVVETQEQPAIELQTIPSGSPARLTTQPQSERDENKPFGQVVKAIGTSLESLKDLDRHNASYRAMSHYLQQLLSLRTQYQGQSNRDKLNDVDELLRHFEPIPQLVVTLRKASERERHAQLDQTRAIIHDFYQQSQPRLTNNNATAATVALVLVVGSLGGALGIAASTLMTPAMLGAAPLLATSYAGIQVATALSCAIVAVLFGLLTASQCRHYFFAPQNALKAVKTEVERELNQIGVGNH